MADADGYGYKKGDYIRIDENGHVKQPWIVVKSRTIPSRWTEKWAPTAPTRSVQRYRQRWDDVIKVTDKEFPSNNPDRWIGRGALFADYYKPSTQATSFGPYTLKMGEKLEFSIAECVGFMETPGRRIRGGPKKKLQLLHRLGQPADRDSGRDRDRTLHYGFGYPDYVNSNVRTVHDVPIRCTGPISGQEPTLPVWPEDQSQGRQLFHTRAATCSAHQGHKHRDRRGQNSLEKGCGKLHPSESDRPARQVYRLFRPSSRRPMEAANHRQPRVIPQYRWKL